MFRNDSITIVHAEGSPTFLGIDWAAFGLVFVVAFAAAALLVTVYATGLRLLAVGSSDDDGPDGAVALGARGDRPLAATLGGYLCLVICVAAVLYGLYLIIPQFH